MNSDKEDYQFGAFLRTMRQARCMSLSELARRAGVAKGHLSEVERGNSDPSLSVLVKLARALELTLSELFRQAGL